MTAEFKTLRRKGVCIRGHTLTDDNSLTWVDRHGRTHRKCKTCRARLRAGEILPYDWNGEPSERSTQDG